MKKYLYWTIGLLTFGLIVFKKREEIKDVVEEVIKFIKPALGRITSGFGNRIHPVTGEYHFHNGIDIAGKEGDPVVAPADGVVTSIFYNDIGGNQMIIKHNNGYTSGYAHLKRSLVKVNDVVYKADLIAEIGKSGRVTGPHLHFTIKNLLNNYIDPTKFIS